MKLDEEIDIIDLAGRVNYDPETGKLWWTNHYWKTKVGKRAGIQKKNGYRYINFKYVSVFEHRVIWYLHYGSWPKNEIDHINGNKSDNRIKNLRDVDRSINMRNTQRGSLNKSGVLGVCWRSQRGKWSAFIKVRKKRIWLGSFRDFQDAVEARRAAEIKYGFHANHGRESLNG